MLASSRHRSGIICSRSQQRAPGQPRATLPGLSRLTFAGGSADTVNLPPSMFVGFFFFFFCPFVLPPEAHHPQHLASQSVKEAKEIISKLVPESIPSSCHVREVMLHLMSWNLQFRN